MSKDCTYKEPTAEQYDVLTGLVMGDGFVGRNSKNPYIGATTTNREYLEYLDKLFPILGTGLEEVSNLSAFDGGSTENYSEQWAWRSRCNPAFNQYADWYESGKKVWPPDIQMTPTTLTHLYCGDGCLVNGRSIKITMKNEKANAEKVAGYFTDVGLPEPDYWNSHSACWNVAGSQQLLDYMGEPLSGFDYKWP
jgi:hypothetical protein